MIFITQLVYIVPGQEDVFDEFERTAIPLIEKHRGTLLLRIRPSDQDFIEHHIDKPYEIHLVQFKTGEDFELFMQDETRKEFLHLKERSIQSSFLIKGTTG